MNRAHFSARLRLPRGAALTPTRAGGQITDLRLVCGGYCDTEHDPRGLVLDLAVARLAHRFWRHRGAA